MITINTFTDPTCPFGYSAEPARLKLKWVYGEQINWQTTLIVLSSTPQDNAVKNFTPEVQARVLQRVSKKHLMPININQRERVAVSKPISKAYTALRLFDPKYAEVFLRNARIASMNGELVDEQKVIDAVLLKSGVDMDKYKKWITQDDVEKQLQSDMQESRSPAKYSLALSSKLSTMPNKNMRYSSPTYRFIKDDDIKFEVPGFWSEPIYEAVLANIAPDYKKNPATTDIEAILAWADYPLSTQEVAVISERGFEETKAKLSKIAKFEPLGSDGFWHL